MNLDVIKAAGARDIVKNAANRVTRQQALSALLRDGFPTRRDEAWKYTKAGPFASFAIDALSTETSNASLPDVADIVASRAKGYALVFINGERMTDLENLPAGISISDPAGEADVPTGAEHALLQLATALPDSDLAINIAEGVTIDAPLNVIHIAETGALAQTRIHIESAANSSVVIAEHFVNLDEAGQSMSNHAMQVNLASSSSLKIYRVQELGTEALLSTRIDATIDTAASFEAFTLDAGAKLTRNDINAKLIGSDATITMKGLYLIDGRQHVDNHTRVDHIAKDTRSDEDYRGILRDHSRAVFNGKVVVHEGADGTDAVQSNPNLLLSDHAEIDTKPELEIYADDVKCAHGATVGQLDEKSLFYLRSRGVDLATATQLLTYAFCRETLHDVADADFRNHLEKVIAEQIPDFTALDLIE
ncbi:MAG: Fe-S cluster assembly protein SufD [Woeseiaceae bacterium]